MADNTIPRASIEETSLDGEPATDKAFTNMADGYHYRVRIVPRETDASTASLYMRAYLVTITRLDGDKTVERNSDGTVDIVASDVVTINSETFANGASPAETFQMIIEQMIYRASNTAAKKAELDDFMANWRG